MAVIRRPLFAQRCPLKRDDIVEPSAQVEGRDGVIGRFIVIIPTQNERDNLPLLVPAILKQSEQLEVLIVDDNSPSQKSSWAHLGYLASRVPMNHAIWRAAEAGAIAPWLSRRPLLDLGCGDGSFTQMLLPSGADAGVDLRREQLVRAGNRGVYRARILAEASELPFRDASFEGVLSNCVLEHVKDVDTAVREVGRVLKPGGHFVFTVPTNQFESYLLVPRVLRAVGLGRIGKGYVNLMNRYFKHYHINCPQRWRERCEAGAMRVVDSKLLMPPQAIAFWDALMPVAAAQLLTRRLGRKSYSFERRLLGLLSPVVKPMLSVQDATGGNIAFLALRE